MINQKRGILKNVKILSLFFHLESIDKMFKLLRDEDGQLMFFKLKTDFFLPTLVLVPVHEVLLLTVHDCHDVFYARRYLGLIYHHGLTYCLFDGFCLDIQRN